MTIPETGAPPSAPPRRPSPWLGPIRVTGAVLGTGLIGLGTLGVVAQFATQVEKTSFNVGDPVKALTVDVGAGDVRIYADPNFDSVQVEATTRSAFRQASYNRTVRDGALSLTGSCTGSWISLDNCSVDFQITVPADIRVDVHSDAGDQWITDVTEPVRLRAGSGDIAVNGVTGDLTARTGSGDINGDRLSSGRAELRTGSGDISADFLGTTSAVTARTGSGDVRTDFLVPPAQLTTKTGSGDVRVFVPQDGARYDVTGSTGSGDRRIAVPTGSSDHRIVANTGSGDVTVDFR